MKKIIKRILIGIVVLLLLLVGTFFVLVNFGANMEDVPNPITDKASKDWSVQEQAVERNPQRNVYFGDLHVHTHLSLDAFFTGNERTPDDAYRFAKGESINVVGNNVQLRRPLDFTAITDHSEFLGEMYSYHNEDAAKHNSVPVQLLMRLRRRVLEEKNVKGKFRRLVQNPLILKNQHPAIFPGYEYTKSNWNVILKAAEEHYEPGKFTTLAGYEWTQGYLAHAHRNVIFRDMVVPDYPISSVEAQNELTFWQSLERYSDEGSTVLAIPHNSNLSRGKMFTTKKPDGQPIDKEYAALRNRFEKLVEIHQNKGNSEVYAEFWKNDEYAGFENYYEGILEKSSFVRDVLKQGLKYNEEFGVNPYKYGMIGSTDTHNSTPGNVDEDTKTPGHFGYSDATAEVRCTEGWAISGDRPPGKVYNATNPGGLVAVWAEANTRSDIFDALARKETYATSGNRVQVRFFGGYDFAKNYENYDDLVKAGYEKGIPMGGDLKQSANAPSFLIWATKDPEAANLERIQIIKGWYDGKELHEKIYDVVLADNIEGATVNLKTGEWDKTKGSVELMTVWTDPDFNKDQYAFYYLRVLEIPTARWNLWDEINHGVKYPDDVPKTIQERAWSSPIWFVLE